MTTTAAELRALRPGTAFTGTDVVRQVQRRTARNGHEFLAIELGDRTGTFSCNVFGDSPLLPAFTAPGAEGGVVEVSGHADFYQDRPSPRLGTATLADPATLPSDIADRLVEVPRENLADLAAELDAAVADLRPPALAAAVRAVLDDLGDRFRSAPAASAMHHAYRGGLLEHTVHCVRAGRALLPLYPEVEGNLALAGLILHDTGKALEFTPGLAPRRGREGLLNGHVVLGYRLLRRAALQARLDPDRVERLEHIILSHQGEPEWGAAIRAATPEAVFVSLVDNLDAKMGAVQQALRRAPPGVEFSERVKAIETDLLVTPVPPAP